MFPLVKLADCVDLLAGFAFKSQQFTDRPDDIPLVKGENVSQGCILWDISKRWPMADWPSLEKYQLRAGDVVVAMDRPWVPAGLKWAYIREDDPKALLVQRCSRLRSNTSKLDQSFLRFVIGGPGFESYVKPITTGVNVPHISGKQILDYEFSLPPFPIQQRISGILSAYDELIENSQRRIKILETMARSLYREWFVYFRFPGHESVPRVPSPLGDIPKGWEVTELARVCVAGNGIQTGPFGSQLHESDYSESGVPVVMPKDIIGFRIRTDSIARIPEETADKLSRHRMQPGDIVYGRRGDIGRRAFVMPHQSRWFCGTGCLRIRPNLDAVNGWYLFNYLGQNDVVGLIQGRAQGVTMLNLNTGILSSVPVRLPPRQLQDNFARLTFSMAEAHEALSAKIDNLRRTRDLLLPRLLSGQVDVEALSA
ncbi:MAG: restriction endonuclease subunit S [Myxococcales bacterium]|nr:restriction endonuclease subunit S [Myxococcales bacterium]